MARETQPPVRESDGRKRRKLGVTLFLAAVALVLGTMAAAALYVFLPASHGRDGGPTLRIADSAMILPMPPPEEADPVPAAAPVEAAVSENPVSVPSTPSVSEATETGEASETDEATSSPKQPGETMTGEESVEATETVAQTPDPEATANGDAALAPEEGLGAAPPDEASDRTDTPSDPAPSDPTPSDPTPSSNAGPEPSPDEAAPLVPTAPLASVEDTTTSTEDAGQGATATEHPNEAQSEADQTEALQAGALQTGALQTGDPQGGTEAAVELGAAFQQNPTLEPAPKQAAVPTQEQSAALPRLTNPAANAAWRRFASPFEPRDQRPRIAVVVTGLGLTDSATEAAIKLLPPTVTLSFTPYARNLQNWIALARAHGHEVMLDLPMEPITFPADDPGPQALLTTLPPEENRKRLDWILRRGSAFVGLVGTMGSRYSTIDRSMRATLSVLRDKGLLYVDNRPVPQSIGARVADQLGVPRAINNRMIDERQASRIAIDARLVQIERIAKSEGTAVALARPFPVSLERLVQWTATLDEAGFDLAPITAVANRQRLR